MNPILNNPGLSNSDNFLVIELLRIVNSLPEGLGWALWLFSLLRHCAVMVFLNVLIKHFSINTIYRALDSIKFKALNLLGLLGYKSMVYEVDFCRLYNPSEEEMKNYNWHQRVLQFFGCDTMNPSGGGYMYSTYYTKYNSRRIITKAPEGFYLPCFFVTLSAPQENKVISKVSLMLYYRSDTIIEKIEKLNNNLDLLPLSDCASFVSINFNNKVCTPKTVISNPLIPIKNYQKLSDIICRYTKIQNSLGYKNINAISIDGEPGLGKTSFMDYFSHNHRDDYQIIYIDMIKNYKTKFDEMYNNLLRIIENSGNAMPTPIVQNSITNNIITTDPKNQYDKGIVIMIDEIDKYVDMHIEFLHNTKKDAGEDDDKETEANKNNDDQNTVIASQRCHVCCKEGKNMTNCRMCSILVHSPNSQRGSLCSMSLEGNVFCIPCGAKELEYKESEMEYKESIVDTQEDDGRLIVCGRNGYYNPQVPCGRTGYYNPRPALDLYAPTIPFPSAGTRKNVEILDITPSTEEHIPKSGKYFKKEILYRLLDLINQKVKQPTYLIFCTNNFNSIWDDLNQRHFNHLKALKSRFIQIHFTRLDKPNLIDILRDINETFKKKLPEKYVVDDEFIALTAKIPEDFQLTIRELHHLLIRSMYDLVQFIDLLSE